MKKETYIEVVATKNPELMKTGVGSWQRATEVYESIKKTHPQARLTNISTLNDLEEVVQRKPDLVFAGMKWVVFINGNVDIDTYIPPDPSGKVWVSEFFEKNRINFTGLRKNSMELEINKDMAKQQVFSHGIPTSPFFIAGKGEYTTQEEMPIDFPIFLKPVRGVRSVGVDENSLVYDIHRYRKKVRSINQNFNQPALAEEFLPGKEYTVAVFSDEKGNVKEAYVGEIKLKDGYEVLSEEVKAGHHEDIVNVADKKLEKKILKLVKRANKALGGRDYVRIDVKLDKNGEAVFLELNGTPGLSAEKHSGYFTEICRNNGIEFDEVISKIINAALNRGLPKTKEEIQPRQENFGIAYSDIIKSQQRGRG